MTCYLAPWKKYAIFRGRAGRKEYWTFMLGNLAIFILLGLVEGSEGVFADDGKIGPASIVFAIALIVPALAATARRLHDTGRSAWWLLLGLLPILNVVQFVLTLLRSTPEENKYGPNPNDIAARGDGTLA